ncbi:MAG: cysteine dioxygenase family protein [Pseudonocardia sp.]|mgnify:CR=1 FL=1
MLLHAPRRGAPSSLRSLTELTRRIAAEVRAGRHPIEVDATQRWYRRLHLDVRLDDYVDIWLIGWATDQNTELHDHAGSLGALTVVSGTLTEQRWSPLTRRLRTRPLHAGHSVSFAPGHVHDVVNHAPAPAVSVHAYSPPLTAMSYYAVEPAGLRRTRTVLTEVTPG